MWQLFFHTFKLFTWDLAYNLGYWPIWWYSRGLVEFWQFISRRIIGIWHNWALDILVKNWLKPMYAQSDWQGRILSFFFRTLIIVWRLMFFLVFSLVLLFLFLLWIVILPLSWFMLIYIFFIVNR